MAGRLTLWLGIVLALAGCRREREPPPKPKVSASRAQSSAPPPRANEPAPEREEPPEQPKDAGPDAAASAAFVLDELTDVGPAGPAASSRAGVVFVTRAGQVALARLKQPLGRGGRPTRTAIEPVTLPAEQFVPFGRAPGVDGGAAYWVHKRRLLRAPLAGGTPPQVLANDARDGTRVAVLPGKPVLAAYIAWKPGAEALIAKLWSENKPVLELTPSGAASNSVALVRTTNGATVAVAIEGRTGMSPVHARVLDVAGWRLEDDVVVWVGGSTQPLTELSAVADGAEVSTFLPIERDASSFGLARLQIAVPPRMNADVSWRMYPNGVDPAPVATGMVCGQPAVAYVRPETAAPRSPLELHLALLGEQGLGASTVIGRSLRFVDVTLAGLERGALIAYVADRRTWARTLRCKTGAN